MSWVSIVSFSVCFLLLITAFLRRADVFAPFRVFGFIWSLAIGLADLKFSFFQHEWSAYSWLTLLTGVSSMMLGFFVAYVGFFDKPMLSFTDQRKRIVQAAISEDVFFRTIVTLTLLYVVGFVLEVLIEGYIPAFAARPDKARVEFGVFGIHLFVTTVPTILLLGVQYLVLFWKMCSNFRKLLITTICVLVFLSFALLLQRFGYIMWLVPTLVFVHYSAGRIKVRHFVLLAIIMFGFLQAIQSIRLSRYVENYIYVISRVSFPKTYALLAEPYMYIVMNLENFARSVERWSSYTYGYFTFDFLMALTGLKHPLAKEFGLVERPFLISGYNTFSFFLPFYQDFGIFGVALIPLCLGVAIGYCYHTMRRNPSLANVTIYGFAVYILVISFFIHALGMLTTFSNLALLVLVHYFVFRPKKTGLPINGASRRL